MLCSRAQPPRRHERRNSWNKKVNLPRGQSRKAALGILACARSAAKLRSQMLAAGRSVIRPKFSVRLYFLKKPLIWGPLMFCGGGTPWGPACARRRVRRSPRSRLTPHHPGL